ncbi:hypothetical protein LEP1GSC105_2111 [Leptospira interrogans str. UI 12758]|uniref:Uncharacterized protein n=1 Tax=Leptospira interrogans str. UI 12758 TaxID=1049938 RepID=A0A0E2D7V0_LEPIR|nr:hypothetical protein LEP1GSC105_2111 [Leptospira interrogans str. UI 12758]
MKLQEFVWIDNVGSGFSGVTEKCFRFSLKKSRGGKFRI